MIHVGNCLDILPTLESGSVQTCITSPPYFGLRDYGMADQIGLESTPADFVDAIVRVFREVRRVLRDDGTVWLNLGDSYSRGERVNNPNDSMRGTGFHEEVTAAGGYAQISKAGSSDGSVGRGDRPGSRAVCEGLTSKQLLGIPWRVAFALQADGWYLRQDIIWAKPNPMPESVRDRCTKAHEYLFLLSKGPKYYFDSDAISEPLAESSVSRLTQPTLADQIGSDRVPGKTNGTMKAVRSSGNKARKNGTERGCPEGTGSNVCGSVPWEGNTRNKRSVWTVATMPFSEAHFATFPESLIEPCVLAGAPVGGLVLDPFMGAGTTAVVASRMGREFVGCELNPAYAEIANNRLRGQTMGFQFQEVANGA